jgi:hypothetical protein
MAEGGIQLVRPPEAQSLRIMAHREHLFGRQVLRHCVRQGFGSAHCFGAGRDGVVGASQPSKVHGEPIEAFEPKTQITAVVVIGGPQFLD